MVPAKDMGKAEIEQAIWAAIRRLRIYGCCLAFKHSEPEHLREMNTEVRGLMAMVSSANQGGEFIGDNEAEFLLISLNNLFVAYGAEQ